jgi:hypothetical protein
MLRPRLPSVFVVVCALILVAVATTAQGFTAYLSGGQQVPPVRTIAQGSAIFQLTTDGSALVFRLFVADIEKVSAAHVRMGGMGSNGPIVAYLFQGPTTPGRTRGVIAAGRITASNLLGPLAGRPVSTLVDLMQGGSTYVIVHTEASPRGEIAGPIR